MNVNDPRWASIDAFVEENRDNILRDITRLVAVPLIVLLKSYTDEKSMSSKLFVKSFNKSFILERFSSVSLELSLLESKRMSLN